MKQEFTRNTAMIKILLLMAMIALSIVAFTAQGYAASEDGNAVETWNIGGDGKAVYNESTAKDNVAATLYEDGELVISGSGDTAPFNQNVNAPWYSDYRNQVKKITFEDGVKPTSLSYFANGCTALTAAPAIPSSVTSLDNTFRNCASLSTAPTIPSSVANMRGTFNNCKALTTPPQIPDGVKNMDSTFYGCSKLAEAPTIPSSVTYLRGLFTACKALKTAPQMPAGITTMQTVFSGCVNLTTAPEIPDSVTDMQSSFRDCAALKGEMKVNAVTVNSYENCFLNASTDGGQLVLRYSSDSENTVDKLLTTKSANSDIVKGAGKPIKSWNIGGDGVTLYTASTAKDNVKATLYEGGELRISGEGNTAVFKTFDYPLNCPPWSDKEYKGDVRRINFEKGVRPTNIDRFAYGCGLLTTVSEIPDSVTTMDYTFVDCYELKAVPNIPEKVTEMYVSFYGCSSLTTIPKIPDGVTTLKSTFNNCSSLRTAPEIPDSVKNMDFAFGACTSLVDPPEIPDGVTIIDFTFYGCSSLKTAPEIPNGVTTMGCTFWGCSSLKVAPKIPSNVTSLGSTFYGCTALKTAPKIPDNVTYMNGAFQGCSSLVTAPDIPDSVTNLGDAFNGCTKLKGEMQINAQNVRSNDRCFMGATTDGGKLILNYGPGAEGTINNLLRTQSSNSYIVKGIETPVI